MKVHLIMAPTRFPLNYGDLGKGTDPPLGILYLAAFARKFVATAEFIITDGLLDGYQKTLEVILEEKADIVGFSAVTTNIMAAYDLITAIRAQLPKTKIILGGPHATAMPTEAFDRSAPDIVVIGEGEQTFVELLECYEREGFSCEGLKNINGICFLDGVKIIRTEPREIVADLDTIPFPARDLVNMENYKGYQISKAVPATAYMSSRGCPFACTFCSNNVWKNAKPYYRVRSPENIADEIEMLAKDGYKEFFDYADEFNTRLDHSKAILREISRRKLKVYLKCQLRAKPIDEELVRLMKKAGIWYVHLGIETGNPETLKGIKKNVSLGDVETCCRLLKKYDIKIWGLFMYFNIWESDNNLVVEDLKKSMQTFEYAKKLYRQKLIDYFGGSICTPTPGSELWDIAIRNNLIKKESIGQWDQWFYKRELRLVSHFPGVDERDIFKLHQKTFRYIVFSLLTGKVVNLKNLKFTLLRGYYFLRRQLSIFLGKRKKSEIPGKTGKND